MAAKKSRKKARKSRSKAGKRRKKTAAKSGRGRKKGRKKSTRKVGHTRKKARRKSRGGKMPLEVIAKHARSLKRNARAAAVYRAILK